MTRINEGIKQVRDGVWAEKCRPDIACAAEGEWKMML